MLDRVARVQEVEGAEVQVRTKKKKGFPMLKGEKSVIYNLSFMTRVYIHDYIHISQKIIPEEMNINYLLQREKLQTRDYKMLKKRSEHLFVCLHLGTEKCE